MGQKAKLAQELDARASAARSLAEAQALHEAADRLRSVRRFSPLGPWLGQAILRN